MSEGLNRVSLLGNLGADPELRVTPNGQAILKLRLATTESYLDRNNARQERTEWHQVTVFGKRGEGLAKILGKGDRLYVDGRLQTSSYEKDGEKRYRTEVIATNVLLSGGRRDGAQTPAPAPTAQRAPSRAAEPRRAPPPPDDFGGGAVDESEISY